MRIALTIVFLLVSAASADEPQRDDALRATMKGLEGTWEGYAVEGSGERPDRGPVHLQVTITDSKISAVDLGGGKKDMGSGMYKIDLTKPVHQIDATGIVLPGKRERTFLGIFELNGDTLKWCVDNRQKERPTEFRTAGGKYLLILKRKEKE